MTTYQTPIVIGIFQDELKAKGAVDGLRDAGFHYDQVGVAITGSNNATPNLAADLMNLGVPQEQANYYDSEYKSGHIVISVRPDGRENEVKEILQNNGAYNHSADHNRSSEFKPADDGVTPPATENNQARAEQDAVAEAATDQETNGGINQGK